MKLTRLRLSNFRSFGAEPSEIDFADLAFLIGPNGAGKTAVLVALTRMFGIDQSQRRIRKADFHIPSHETADSAPAQRALWMEADFEFPELSAEDAEEGSLLAVPGHFAHMQLATEDGPAMVRFRLAATIDEYDEIEESLRFVLATDDAGTPVSEERVSSQDRSAVRVHYLPARRDPADHISYSTSTLLGRALRSLKWGPERDKSAELAQELNDALRSNPGIEGVSAALADLWGTLHKGAVFANPALAFAGHDIERVLRHLSVIFTPGHGEETVDYARLSDGQQSLLYISLILALHRIESKVLDGELTTEFDIDKLRPAAFSLIAVEEPENSLSPHYLGRVLSALSSFSRRPDTQAVVATHSPSVLRRIPPESIRYFRLNESRCTVVKSITLPENSVAEKFVREGVQSFPELYFARLVVLGEGDSEQIVLPRILEARGLLSDDASITIAPLGGRHVNHLWRLLSALGIPHLTLLDLDVARYQGGWGRVRYAAEQLQKYSPGDEEIVPTEDLDAVPGWDADEGIVVDDLGWIPRLESLGIYFSAPLDLDFSMLTHFPKAYRVKDDECAAPDEGTLQAVLGKKHDVVENQYSDEQQSFFEAYHCRFKIGSKPTWHIRALASISNAELVAGMPPELVRLCDAIELALKSLPE